MTVMKLVFLGTAGYHPADTRHTSCAMLPEIGVVIDAGTAFYRVRERIVTDTLDIFLTHGHLDHTMGLTFLLNVMRGKSLKRVTVHGEAAKLASLRDHLFHPDLFPVLPAVEWHELTGPVELPDGGRVSWWPQRHPGGSIGFRFDWPGRSLAWVTDTTAAVDADYVPHIENADVLCHECNFADGQESFAELTGHSCATPVAQVAARAKVGRLMLMHFDPLMPADRPVDLARIRAVFPRTDVSADGLSIDF